MSRRGRLLSALGLLGLVAGGPAAGVGPRFVDRSAAAGLAIVTWSGSVEKPHILESTGNGVLILDYDGDGWQDVYLVSAYRLPRRKDDPMERSALFRNLGDGTFADVTDRAGVGARVYGHGGCVGDVDADGLPDLYVTAFGPNLLYRNNGDGTFSEGAAAAGVAEPGWSIGAAFLDADGDGHQDLFVASYIEATWEEVLAARRVRLWRGRVAVMDGPRGFAEGRNAFYRNRGDGTFVEATEESGLAAGGMAYTMGVASFDYDNDGDLDLYLANDSMPNRLYRNRGDGTFDEVATWAGSAYNADGRAQGSMGVGTGDYDGDGWLDLAVTNFAHDHYAVYRNLGGELFRDASFSTRVAVATFAPLGWAAIFFDADNDRDLDLFFSNGHIYPQVDEDPSLAESYRQRNQLLLNESGVFRDAGADSGEAFSILESSRGAAAVDLDNDGDLDLVVSNQDAAPSVLENVTRPAGHWIGIDARGPSGTGRPLGTRIEASAAGARQIRETASGGGYASEGDPRLHVGLGDASSVDRLSIAWPGAARGAYLGLGSGRLYVIPAPRPGSPGGS